MHLNLTIKTIICCCYCLQMVAQQDSLSLGGDNRKIPLLYDQSRQFTGSITTVYQLPLGYGDNFIGESLDGQDGLAFSLNLFLFKNFYLGANYGISNFDVTDKASLGNYQETQIEERYLTLGYELLPLKNIRLGLFTSLFGEATLTNEGQGVSNRDSGKLWIYGLKLEYEIVDNLSLLLVYDWRRIKTNINVPSEISDFFQIGTYNNLSFGLKFNFGKSDILKSIQL